MAKKGEDVGLIEWDEFKIAFLDRSIRAKGCQDLRVHHPLPMEHECERV